MVNERRRVSEIKNYVSVNFFFYSEIQSDDRRREYHINCTYRQKLKRIYLNIHTDLFIVKINYEQSRH